MAKIRKIMRRPNSGRNYYVIDTNFLVNKFIPADVAPVGHERDRVRACQDWWAEIDAQLEHKRARVYVPDICVAESFKVLANKYYGKSSWFKTKNGFAQAKKKLADFIHIAPRTLQSLRRNIRVHDVPTTRDIIVSVDRFLELFQKNGKNVQVADLILAASAKYLMDFYDIPKDRLHIVTLDNALREGIAKVAELPRAYDPTKSNCLAGVVFETGAAQ